MVRVRPLLFSLLLITACWSAAAAPAGPKSDDRFLEGVASAYLELHFGRTDIEVAVEDGRLWLDPAALDGLDPQAVRAVLEGVRGLEVVLAPRPAPARRQLRIVDAAAPLPLPGRDQTDADLLTTGFLPEQELFEGPLADPRSPSIGGALVPTRATSSWAPSAGSTSAARCRSTAGRWPAGPGRPASRAECSRFSTSNALRAS